MKIQKKSKSSRTIGGSPNVDTPNVHIHFHFFEGL